MLKGYIDQVMVRPRGQIYSFPGFGLISTIWISMITLKQRKDRTPCFFGKALGSSDAVIRRLSPVAGDEHLRNLSCPLPLW